MYIVTKEFNGLKIGDKVELNDRRAKSEIANGNVKEYKKRNTKEEKRVKRTK